MRSESMNKNFLNLTKYFNKQPKQNIISSYLTQQFSFLSSKKEKISFLEFYNYISLPFELSLRLFKTLTNPHTNQSPENMFISNIQFVNGLSRLFSDCTVEKKIELAIKFLSLSTDPERIYKDDMLILFDQFHLIKNTKETLSFIDDIVDNFFRDDQYLTLEEFNLRSYNDNSTLLYLVLFFLVYNRPFQYESIEFYEKNVFKKDKTLRCLDCDCDVVDFFFVQSFPQNELYEYLYQCYDIFAFEIDSDFDELANFESSLSEIKNEFIYYNKKVECKGFLKKPHQSNSFNVIMPKKKRLPSLSSMSCIERQSSNSLNSPKLKNFFKYSSVGFNEEDDSIFSLVLYLRSEREMKKHVIKITGDDIFIFRHNEESDELIFRQIIPLKQLYINEGENGEDIVDSNENRVYHAVHLISTMTNKIKNCVIYIVEKGAIVRFKKVINKVTHFKAIEENYVIDTIIGRGSFGTVVKGRDKKTQNIVAIKILQKDFSKSDMIPIIRNEIDIIKYIKSLDIEGVIKTYEIIEHFDCVCLIQEFADGGNLNDLITHRTDNSPLSNINENYSLISQLINSIQSLHKYGIIHRDLKCDNIMLDSNKNVKIIDFGLAGIKTHHDAINDVYGTLPYLSPEIVKGEMYSNKVDVWALGIMMYQLMYSKYIFEGNTINEIANKILYMKIKVDRSIDKESEKVKKVNDLIIACLNREAKKRPDINSIAEMLF